jgi:protein-S-isoprenylcysteine O-methyltransferase Ste14
MAEPLQNAGVRFPPPLLFVAGLAIGLLLDHGVRALPLSHIGWALLEGAGVGLVLAGGCLVAWGMLTFRAARTAIVPHHPASRLVERGPYRFTRNPMYTGLTIAYIGGALILNTAWAIIILPAVLALLVRLVVRREEAYLSDAFGAEYTAYQSRVRRWL